MRWKEEQAAGVVFSVFRFVSISIPSLYHRRTTATSSYHIDIHPSHLDITPRLRNINSTAFYRIGINHYPSLCLC